MRLRLDAGRAAWFGAGVIAGLLLAELLPATLSYLLDLIQALDFALS